MRFNSKSFQLALIGIKSGKAVEFDLDRELAGAAAPALDVMLEAIRTG